jgi:hypothetical protein
MPFPDFVCHTAPSGPNPPGRLTETFAGVTPEMVTPIWFSETSTSIVCYKEKQNDDGVILAVGWPGQ